MLATSFMSGVLHKRLRVCSAWLIRYRLPAATLSCCTAVALVDGQYSWGIPLCLLLLTLALADSRKFFFVSLALCGICAGLHLMQRRSFDQRQHLLASGRLAELTAKTIKPSKQRLNTGEAEARIIQCSLGELENSRVLLGGKGLAPGLGQNIQANGHFSVVKGPRNDGEFDHAQWLKRQGVLGRFFANHHETLADKDDPLLHATEKIRDHFRDAITRGLPAESDEAKVIKAMVMGEQPPYQDEILRPFRESGTLHLFSVSGQHVNLVAMLLWLVLRFCRVPRKSAILLLIPFVFSYAWITGASAPAMRAAWMSAVFLSAFFFQRKPDLLNALAVVMIAALLVDGNLLFLAGVQLSYGVVAAIAIGLGFLNKYIRNLNIHDIYLPKDLYSNGQILREKIAHHLLQALGVSTFASLGSAPLTIRHFSMITPVSIFANLILAPLVTALLGLAMLAICLSMVSSDAVIYCNRLNGWVASRCIDFSEFFASIPGGHATISFHRPSSDAIQVFDIADGGAAVLLQTDNADCLLDTGDQRSFRNIVLPCLRYFGSEPDTILLSHPESGHVGGTMTAVENFHIKQIIVPVATSHASTFNAICGNAPLRGSEVYYAKPHAVMQVSKHTSWEILQTADAADENAAADERVALYLLHFHQHRILFVNDAGPRALRQLGLDYKDLRCDVVVTGRNYLHAPPDIAWLRQWGARAVIATHADFPASEAIPESWQNELANAGIALFHQGRTGMVGMRHGPNDVLLLTGFLNRQGSTLPPVPVTSR
jgi:ComEC/Rec2-related protein